jgi:hypothetical protein
MKPPRYSRAVVVRPIPEMPWITLDMRVLNPAYRNRKVAPPRPKAAVK